MKCQISGWFFIPNDLLTDYLKQDIESNLSYRSPFLNDDGTRKSFDMFQILEEGYNVPIEWAKISLPYLYEEAEDLRIVNHGLDHIRLPSHNHPRVKNPEAQKAFMDDLLSQLQTNNNCFAMAATGSGKTVCALWVAGMLNMKTAILVPTESLKDQWIEEIQDKLGIPRDKIGIVQQDKCEIEGKSIVVAMMPSIANRNYTELYQWAGYVVCDEGHRLSTEHLNLVLPNFLARYRLVMTATPNRKDGSQKVMVNHVGKISVVGATEVMPISVHVIKYTSNAILVTDPIELKKEQETAERFLLFKIARDYKRNRALAMLIKSLHDADREILVVSNSVKHLERLLSMCDKLGIPVTDMGLYTAQKTVNKKMVKVTKAELATAKAKKIIFATDGKFKDGVDEPRLNTLVEANLFWNAEQRCGRVRRFVIDKNHVLCFTFLDVGYESAERMYEARKKDYEHIKARITAAN